MCTQTDRNTERSFEEKGTDSQGKKQKAEREREMEMDADEGREGGMWERRWRGERQHCCSVNSLSLPHLFLSHTHTHTHQNRCRMQKSY